MEFVGLDQNGDFIENMSSEQLLPLDTADACGVSGDPQVFPRVGDKYQVDVPPLTPEPEYVNFVNFLIGLPITVMWINKGTGENKGEKEEFPSTDACNNNAPSEFGGVRDSQTFSENEDSRPKVEVLDVRLDRGKQIKVSALIDTTPQCRGPEYCLVPGSVGDSWSDIEKASFLLGLYIFEKNFVQVKRFIGSKRMGCILSFYYGDFYRSREYNRWSSCRKIRSRKCVYGQRIFSGSRQQELLSRLIPQVSEECQKALLKVSKTFGEGKMSLEEYVSSLKAMVGMNILVEAVGIGQGKKDLTGMTMESGKTNQVTHMRPEIPIGKACSSLTPTEIVEFLTGDYRLSKARSSDLFWEAVWPRLLARGWHSEQPKNQNYAIGSKHFLVFLMPGVKKFSRRRLVKGNHYFDSVTDVLSKVASEPGLLELDTEETEGNKKEENGWPCEIEEQDNLPERRRHCYLRPRTPSRSKDVMKFTVVDTSLTDGRTFKIRELRSLPMEISKNRSLSEDNSQDTSEVSTDKSDCGSTMLVDAEETTSTMHTKNLSDMGITSGWQNLDISFLDQGIQVNGPDSTKHSKRSKNRNNLYKDKQTRKAVKTNVSRKQKQNNLEFLVPVTKRHRTLTACSNEELSLSTNSILPRLGEPVHGFCSDTPDMNNKTLSQVVSSQDMFSSTSSSKGSPHESIGGAQDDHYHGLGHLKDNPEPRPLIDLNLPQAPLDFENDVFMTELINRQDDQTSKQADDVLAPKASTNINTSEQQPSMNSRRQGTRNRPPTAKALEALAHGFLTPNRRRKNKENSAHETSSTRSSKCNRVGEGYSEPLTNNACIASKGGNGMYDGVNNDMFDKFQFLSNGNGTKI